MSDEKNAAEPSGVSCGSGACPYVTGTVTRYCTLTPFTLTDAEREVIEWAVRAMRPECLEVLQGLLDRTK